MVSNIFYFHPYLGKCSNLTNIFQMGWNHQLVTFWTQKWRFDSDDLPFRRGAEIRFQPLVSMLSEKLVYLQTVHPGRQTNVHWKIHGWFRCISYLYWNCPSLGDMLVFRDLVTFQIDRDHEIAGCLPCVTCFSSGSGKNELGSRLAFLQKTWTEKQVSSPLIHVYRQEYFLEN